MSRDDAEVAPGRVRAVHGGNMRVEGADGTLVSCRLSPGLKRVVCNDRVGWRQTGAGHGVIEYIEARKNRFCRADRRSRPRLVAANLDQIVIVVAPQPAPSRDLINRYLVACENVGIGAALCINKGDLASPEQDHHIAADVYRALGYPVVGCQAKADDGLESLRALLIGKTSILVGQSGVGKTTIVNRLLPELALRTAKVSHATGKGRHTTTTSTLYDLPCGGTIIDSPGVWEFGVWQMTMVEIASGFREFADWAGACRFPNCSHIHEPGCAVAQAAEQGRLNPERLASYRRIVASS